MSVTTELTEPQKIFCDAFIANGKKLRAAALTAGYSPVIAAVYANKLMKKPHIKKYIDGKLKETKHNYKVNFEYKIKKLGSIIEEMLGEDRRDEKFKKLSPEHARVAIIAIAELNKMQGDHSAEKHINTNLNINADADLKMVNEINARLLEKNRCDF